MTVKPTGTRLPGRLNCHHRLFPFSTASSCHAVIVTKTPLSYHCPKCALSFNTISITNRLTPAFVICILTAN